MFIGLSALFSFCRVPSFHWGGCSTHCFARFWGCDKKSLGCLRGLSQLPRLQTSQFRCIMPAVCCTVGQIGLARTEGCSYWTKVQCLVGRATGICSPPNRQAIAGEAASPRTPGGWSMLSVLRAVCNPPHLGLHRRYPSSLSVSWLWSLSGWKSAVQEWNTLCRRLESTAGKTPVAKVSKYGMLSWIMIIMQVD